MNYGHLMTFLSGTTEKMSSTCLISALYLWQVLTLDGRCSLHILQGQTTFISHQSMKVNLLQCCLQLVFK